VTRALLLLLLAGCFPQRGECVTSGGLEVTGATCESVQPMAERIQANAGGVQGFNRDGLRGALLYIRSEEVDELGGWFSDWHGTRVTCVVWCDMGTAIVGVGPKSVTWDRTALAHAAAHLLENCRTDDSFAPRSAEYDHPQWDVRVQPFLGAVNAVALPIEVTP
jgi:hypothetical protein